MNSALNQQGFGHGTVECPSAGLFRTIFLYLIISLNGSYLVGQFQMKLQGVNFSKYFLLGTPSAGKKITKELEIKVRFTFYRLVLYIMLCKKLNLSFTL